MTKLLNQSLKKIILCAGIVLVCSIPVYYFAISRLWRYELDEHNVMVTPEAGREDSFLIIGAVTLLSVLFFIVLLAALIFLNRYLSRRLWHPFYRSLEHIKSFSLERPSQIDFDKTGILEFDELNSSLNKLISANLAVYTQQKEFADNASHELQTPLAIVQSKLELLSQSKALDEEQFHLIEEAQAALLRAGRINKNLLLLTKIENSQYADKEMVDLAAVLQKQLVEYGTFFENKNLRIETDLSPGVLIEGNVMLIEILTGNLITNAVRYSPPNGIIHLDLKKEHLSISNSGTESLNTDQLFKRFGQASTSTPGTGLGLAIVKQISTRYGWDVSYDFNHNRHCFQVSF